MGNPLHFLDGGVPPIEPVIAPEAQAAPVEVPETPAPEALAQPEGQEAPAQPETPLPEGEGQPRGADGKFLPKADAAPATPAAEPGHVPITAMLDERDKRQKAERENERLQEQLRATKPADGETEDQPIPPEIQALNVKLDISEDLAREKHGDELIDKVQAWAQSRFAQSPDFAREIMSSRNPYAKAVQEFQRHEVMEALRPGDIDAFRAWQAERAKTAETPAAPAVEPQAAAEQPALPSPPPTPPRSIAAAPSAGGTQHVPTGPGQAFDAAFAKG